VVALGGAGAGSARNFAFQFGASPMSAGAEEILKSITIPANTFNVVGQRFRVVWLGSTAANANIKTLRIRFGGLGGTALFTSIAAAFNNRVWCIETILEVRAVPDSQLSGTRFLTNSTIATEIADVEDGAATLDDASDQVLCMTGQGTAAGDIVCSRLSAERWEAPT